MAKKKPSNAGGIILIGAFVWLAATGHLSTITSAFGAAATVPAVAGNWNCSELETLWRSQGGPGSQAFTAAEVARAESGGDARATNYNTNGSVDYGLWQDNTINGANPADYDPALNARLAVRIYDNAGGSWSPWTTYDSGAYQGQC